MVDFQDDSSGSSANLYICTCYTEADYDHDINRQELDSENTWSSTLRNVGTKPELFENVNPSHVICQGEDGDGRRWVTECWVGAVGHNATSTFVDRHPQVNDVVDDENDRAEDHGYGACELMPVAPHFNDDAEPEHSSHQQETDSTAGMTFVVYLPYTASEDGFSDAGDADYSETAARTRASAGSVTDYDYFGSAEDDEFYMNLGNVYSGEQGLNFEGGFDFGTDLDERSADSEEDYCDDGTVTYHRCTYEQVATEALDGEPNACPICVENFKTVDVVSQTKCKHVFHEECLLLWTKAKRTCPLCRMKIRPCTPEE